MTIIFNETDEIVIKSNFVSHQTLSTFCLGTTLKINSKITNCIKKFLKYTVDSLVFQD
jgi:hypothetical protein